MRGEIWIGFCTVYVFWLAYSEPFTLQYLGSLPASNREFAYCVLNAKLILLRISFRSDCYCFRLCLVLSAEMGIHRDNLSAIVIGDNFLPIIVIAQNSLDLSITDIAFVIYFVIADKLSR